jgi:hypothetical protein
VCPNIIVTKSQRLLLCISLHCRDNIVNLSARHNPVRASLPCGVCNCELLDQMSVQLWLLGRAGGPKQTAVISRCTLGHACRPVRGSEGRLITITCLSKLSGPQWHAAADLAVLCKAGHDTQLSLYAPIPCGKPKQLRGCLHCSLHGMASCLDRTHLKGILHRTIERVCAPVVCDKLA